MTTRHLDPSDLPVKIGDAARSIVAALRSDPRAWRLLWVCVLGVYAAATRPPVNTLYSPVVYRGLRLLGSDVPYDLTVIYFILSALLLVGGSLADLGGRRRMFLVALLTFSLSMLLSALLADTPLFAWLDLLGSASSQLALPLSIAIVLTTFPASAKPLAVGVLFAAQTLGQLSGSLLLSLLRALEIDRAAYLLPLIVSLAGSWRVWRRMPETAAPSRARRLSALVYMAWPLMIFALLFTLLAGRPILDSSLLSVGIGLGMGVMVLALRWLSHRSSQLREVQLRNFRLLLLALAGSTILFFAQGALLYQISTYFQDVQQVGPIWAIVRLVPLLAGMVVAAVAVAPLSVRYGAARLMPAGLAIAGTGLIGLGGVAVQTPFLLMLIPLFLIGFGSNLAVPLLTGQVLEAAPIDLRGSAAAANSAAGLAGNGLGAIVSSVLVAQLAYQDYQTALKAAGFTPDQLMVATRALEYVAGQAITSPFAPLPDTLETTARYIYGLAFTAGLGQVFLILGGVLMLAALVLYLGLRARSTPQ